MDNRMTQTLVMNTLADAHWEKVFAGFNASP
jgi:hypothetical protein